MTDLVDDNSNNPAPAGTVTPVVTPTIDPPVTMTPVSAGDISTPNNLARVASGSIGTPTTFAPVGAGTISTPNSLSRVSAGNISTPNTLTGVTAGDISTPNTLNRIAAGSVATPNTLAPVAAQHINRVVKPIISFDFLSQTFSELGQAKTLTEIVDYSRASSATYIETFTNNLGEKDKRITTVNANVPRFEDEGYLTEGASTNLQIHSEDFDNIAWVKNNATVAPNDTIAPDGSLSADKLSASTTGSIAPSLGDSTVSVIGTKYTTSFYVKASEVPFVQINYGVSFATGSPRANFNLLSGVVEIADSEIDADIKEISNGWFRISSTVTAASTTYQGFLFLIKDPLQSRASASSFSSGEGVFVWGAQVEALSGASSYIKTESSAVSRAADVMNYPISILSGNLSVVGSTLFSQASNYLASLNFNTNNSVGILSDSSNNVTALVVRDGVTQALVTSTTLYTEPRKASINFSTNNVTAYLANDNPFTDTLATIPNITQLTVGSVATGGILYGHIKRLQVYNKALTANEVKAL